MLTNANDKKPRLAAPLSDAKFKDPRLTAKGEVRASVPLSSLDTLWINTGTLCNIECQNCYIYSSPTNDELVYFALEDAVKLFDEMAALGIGTREIGFTGGEPFMNPEMIEMAEAALSRGHEVLILTNAMAPMQRPRVKEGLLRLKERYQDQITLRISIDHHTESCHDEERGEGSFAKTLEGVDWLSEHGFSLAVAGRTMWGETEKDARQGYSALYAARGWQIDAFNPSRTVLFPEMDEASDVPEITVACWDILNIKPQAMMCATSRMVIKRKGRDRPQVLPCTLLPYDEGFEMGETLEKSLKADGGNFTNGAVQLNHPHCARFCVLGGGSCSA